MKIYRCYKFQKFLKVVSGKFLKYFKGSSRKFQGCFHCVSRSPNGYFWEFQGYFHSSCLRLSCVLFLPDCLHVSDCYDARSGGGLWTLTSVWVIYDLFECYSSSLVLLPFIYSSCIAHPLCRSEQLLSTTQRTKTNDAEDITCNLIEHSRKPSYMAKVWRYRVFRKIVNLYLMDRNKNEYGWISSCTISSVTRTIIYS